MKIHKRILVIFTLWWGVHSAYAEEAVGDNGPVLALSAKSLMALADGDAVKEWKANIGPSLVYSEHKKLLPPVYKAKSPSGSPAVYFDKDSILGIRDFSKSNLAGKSFTIIMRAIPVSPYFGICGNSVWGDGGIPRLYLTASGITYNELITSINVSSKAALNQETIYIYSYDSTLEKMKMYVNGKLMKEISNIAKTDTFGGGALAVPFRAAGQGQEGYLLDLVIYASALSEVEMSAARQQYIQ